MARPIVVETLESRIAPAFSAVVNLSDLDGGIGTKILGSSYDYSGYVVSDAGDVNGDGFADALISSDGADADAYVVFGKAGSLGAALNLSAIDGTNGFKIRGDGVSSLSTAGDINGDGFDDILVGAYYSSSGEYGYATGATYVIFGKATGFGTTVELSSLNGTNGFKIEGEESYDYSGSSVSGAGDINGDGFDDIIIGAYAADPNGSRSGASYVVFGKATGFTATLELSDLDGLNGFKIYGEAAGDRAGSSVSGAGDVNGDGFNDIVIGARSAPEGYGAGVTYVIFGKAGGFGATLELSSINGTNGFRINGVNDYDFSGSEVSGAGDLNGDGFDDILIGASGESTNGYSSGAAYVVFGKAAGFGASLNLSSLNGINGFVMKGGAEYDYFGASVSAAGDINGDGFDDILIGARGVDHPTGGSSGATYVIFGKSGSFNATLDPSTLDGTIGLKIMGEVGGDSLGRSVSNAGDINGDGVVDILIGSNNSANGSYSGATYVIYGQREVDVFFSKNGRIATFTDIDGDLVSVKVNKGTLSKGDFNFVGAGMWQKLDLSQDALLSGAKVTVSVKKLGGGNGKVSLGYLDARGIDLGLVKLPGDLGQIDVGDNTFTTPALKSLTVGSIGVLTSGLSSTQSDFAGALRKLVVQGDLRGTISVAGGVDGGIGSASIAGNLDGSAGGVFNGLLRATGKIGSVTVKGSVIGGAEFSGVMAGSKLGKVKIGGDLTSSDTENPVVISALGEPNAPTAAKSVAIGGVTVTGNVLNAQILAGYTATLAAANADASIGAIVVGKNWTASSIVAGVADAPVNGFGQNDALISGGLPDVIATIASVRIKGTAIGSTAVGDHFGITAERVSKLKIGTAASVLDRTANNVVLDAANSDFRVVDFA